MAQNKACGKMISAGLAYIWWWPYANETYRSKRISVWDRKQILHWRRQRAYENFNRLLTTQNSKLLPVLSPSPASYLTHQAYVTEDRKFKLNTIKKKYEQTYASREVACRRRNSVLSEPQLNKSSSPSEKGNSAFLASEFCFKLH